VDPYMSVLIMMTISFPEAMLMAYFAIQFMGGKPKLMEVILIGLVQAVVAYIVRSLSIPIGLHTIIQIISFITLIYVVSRVSLWIAAIGITVGAIIEIIFEIITAQVMLKVIGITIEDVINDHYMRIFFYIPVALSILITIVVFKKYGITFGKITKWQYFNDKYRVSQEVGDGVLPREYLPAVIFIFLPIFLLFMLNFAYVSVQVNVNNSYYPDLFKVLFNSLIIALALVSLWALRRINTAVEKEYEAKKAAETIEHLKELILSIRKQRHDFNHQLQAVYGLMETENYSGAREYIQNTYHYVSGTGELIKTDNPPVSALLYSKIGIAETRNIRFDISIECSLEEFPLKSNEASSLMGNLIDNAFDAVEKNEVGGRLVRLDITLERGEYLIEAANRGVIDPQAVEKVFLPNFTTKEGHAGLGLDIVKEIVNKYKGSIRLFSEGGETIFSVSIPLRR